MVRTEWGDLASGPVIATTVEKSRLPSVYSLPMRAAVSASRVQTVSPLLTGLMAEIYVSVGESFKYLESLLEIGSQRVFENCGSQRGGVESRHEDVAWR